MEQHLKICKCNNDIFPINSRRHLNILGDLGVDGWWDWHIQEDFEYMSPGFWKLLGYDPETKKHHPSEWQKIIDENDLLLVIDDFNKHVSTKGKHPFYREVRYKCYDGSIKWVLCRGVVIEWDGDTPIRMIGTHVDMSDVKEREELLYEEQQKHKSVFDYSPHGVAIVGLDGKFLDVNLNVTKMLGFSKEELLLKTYVDITYKDDLDEDMGMVRKLIENEIVFYKMEKRYVCKDDSILWVSIYVSVVRSKKDKPLYFFVQIENINDKKLKSREISKTIFELKKLLSGQDV